MRRMIVGMLFLAGCSGGGLERKGDTALSAGRYADAMSAFQNSGNSPRVLTKYADAALRGGFLAEAVQGWTRLGLENPARVEEAATGLARTALVAERDQNQAILSAALAALHRVDPDWPAGRLLRHLESDRGLSKADAIAVSLLMLAAASDREAANQTLVSLANLNASEGDCQAAIGVYQSVVRRVRAAPGDSILGGMARCELRLGLTALTLVDDTLAENWFEQAIGHDPVGASGRRAMIGLGDVRLKQGDTLSAQTAWRTVVIAAVPPDSLFLIALERLQSLSSPIPDSSVKAPGRL